MASNDPPFKNAGVLRTQAPFSMTVQQPEQKAVMMDVAAELLPSGTFKQIELPLSITKGERLGPILLCQVQLTRGASRHLELAVPSPTFLGSQGKAEGLQIQVNPATCLTQTLRSKS